MGEASQALAFVDAAISEAARHGVVFVSAEDEPLDGRTVRVEGKPVLNFASCSYLGLELDARIQQGAVDATLRYGTQFSSSRTYIEAPLYQELEELLGRITGGSALVTPNTTLGHLSTLPVIVGEDDAVLLDHQVHHTVQLALHQLRAQGSHVEFVRHGRIDQLDERIRLLSQTHPRVWYFADGVYSMYGNLAPMKALTWLLGVHERLHLYVDDAHGTSWTGRHGRGYALENLPRDPRVVVAISLNKAFGAAGGAVVFPDDEMRRRVRTCGGPMIFTGPVQPPMLGAAVASAKIHLSDELAVMQRELAERIQLANELAAELDLPLASRSAVPIRYVGLGPPVASHAMTGRLLERGFYANCATFPAVRARCSGLRFTLTRHHTPADVRALLGAVAELFPGSLAEGGVSRDEVDRAFGLSDRRSRRQSAPVEGLRLEHHTSIDELDGAEWDRLLGARGSFGVHGLRALECAFGQDQKPENRWRFHYYVARRTADGQPVLATFFTEALWKDDLAAAASVSRAVESQRAGDPYFLTSRVLAMGSLLTEGDHLWLDRDADWRGALQLLLARVEEDREAADASLVVFRDLDAGDAELAAQLSEMGFAAVALPASWSLELAGDDWETQLTGLSTRTRRFQRRSVEPFNDAFRVDVYDADSGKLDDEALRHLYGLYRNVQARGFALNTFPLGEDFLSRVQQRPGWEIFTLTPRDENGLPRAFGVGYFDAEQYVPLVPGVDYAYVQSHGAYRQLLRNAVERARARGCTRVLFGMGADLEKARFGARSSERCMFVQSHDHFHHDVMALIAADPSTRSE
jgi:7-keto-8-aminopelargonate synthetase-like enzyme